MFERDRGRLEDCFRRVNVMPLGAGALAGTVLPIDRKFVAKQLGFSGVCENSMDAVSDRDFAIEFWGLRSDHDASFALSEARHLVVSIRFIDLRCA
jgi:argininosuccinate lyase